MPSGAIIVAGGAGRRFGRALPKQFLPLNGEPLLARSVRAFASVRGVGEIVVVSHPDFIGRTSALLRKLRLKKRWSVVPGGDFRGASVRNGFRAVSLKMDAVLVHDAARPLVSRDVIARVDRAARSSGAALAAWPVPDTLKLAAPSGHVRRTIRREKMWLAQTPQGFRRDVAEKCLVHPSPTATDDVELAERRGVRVRLVEGSPMNFKVTYPYDMRLCRLVAGRK